MGADRGAGRRIRAAVFRSKAARAAVATAIVLIVPLRSVLFCIRVEIGTIYRCRSVAASLTFRLFRLHRRIWKKQGVEKGDDMTRRARRGYAGGGGSMRR